MIILRPCSLPPKVVSSDMSRGSLQLMQGNGTDENAMDPEDEIEAPLTNHQLAEQHKRKGTEHYNAKNWSAACQSYG